MVFDRMAFIKKFAIEAKEHLEKINSGLMSLEKNPEDSDTMNEVFRSAHTIKGSARMLKLLDINQIAHKMEDLFGLVKDKKINLGKNLTDLLLESCDAIEECLNATIESRSATVNSEAFVVNLEKAIRGEPFETVSAKRRRNRSQSRLSNPP